MTGPGSSGHAGPGGTSSHPSRCAGGLCRLSRREFVVSAGVVALLVVVPVGMATACGNTFEMKKAGDEASVPP